MSLYGMMRTGASGMTAQANRLTAVSDNIANANTDGYKAESTAFSSLVVPGSIGQYNAGGVEATMRSDVTQSGSIRSTSSSTDLALKGNGFFVVSDANGTPYLTRAGSFVPDANGDLINTAGYYLMGYPYVGSSINPVVNGYAGLQKVNISQQGLVATPTTTGTLSANLPSDATAVAAANLPSANAAGAQFTQKTSLVTYDNLGNQITLDLYLTKTANNQWEMAAYNSADASATGGFPYSSAGPLATTTLQFDPTTGQLAATSATALSVPIPGGQSMSLDLSGMTQLAGGYSIFQANVNGNAPSGLDRVDIASNGDVTAYYQNGSQKLLYKVPVADVPSPDNLMNLSGNVFGTTSQSGNAQIGFAGQSGLATISSGALEGSNVDLATQLTDMITAQRSYTANSKVFQIGADLMNTLVNLVR